MECLDDGILQSYFDGELSAKVMESATLHLASCSNCSAAARELEQETLLLTAALADDFQVSVPTESLRRRIDAAVVELNAPVRVPVQQRGLGFFGGLTSLFNFSPQGVFAYAALIVLIAVVGIFAVMRLKTSEVTPSQVAGNNPVPVKGVVTPDVPNPSVLPTTAKNTVEVVRPHKSNSSSDAPRVVASRFNKPVDRLEKPLPPVKLLPGERSYLQAIARLDTTIKSDKKAMRPALQVEYERNLAVVDRAIAATRTAAKSNPNDPDAADFMFAAYQSKVDLLNTIADARLGDRSH